MRRSLRPQSRPSQADSLPRGALMELPQVRLKIERRSNHPWIFQKMVEKPAERLPAGTRRRHPRPRRHMGRPRLLQRPLAHRPARSHREAGRGDRRGLLRPQASTDAVRLRQRDAEARRRHRRVSARPFRRRRPQRAGRRSLRADAGARILLGRHVPVARRRSRTILATHFPGASSTGSPRSTCRSRSRSTAARPSRRRRSSSPSTALRFRVAPGRSTRPASSSISATTARCWPSSARARRVLDLCCNTGGFAVYAKTLGKAEEVIGVDLDEQVIAAGPARTRT